MNESNIPANFLARILQLWKVKTQTILHQNVSLIHTFLVANSIFQRDSLAVTPFPWHQSIILSPDEWVMVVDYVEEFVIPALTYTLLVLKSPWRVASRTLHTTMLERFETLLIIMCVDREQRSIVFLQYP